MRLRLRSERSPATDHRVVRLAASWCLAYPDDDLLDKVDLLRAGVAETPQTAASNELAAFLDHLSATDPARLRQDYVDVFDLSGRQTLFLTYWTDGDTRRRGETLAAIKRVYRDSGFVVDLRGELPDHLPVVLEFAARVDPERGTTLLAEHRGALELIRFSLLDKKSPYAHVLAAICATLPGESPPDRAAAVAMRGHHPEVETVGLEPFDPRLLPLHTGAEAGALR
ncbi:nitrate reductase molybdenum cofactor assembly chaperone [Gordonia sp. HY002]|uniref:nitrate reductase molybdenum cofactor assembly chaperone n=1 Tax=Gordonia zhenghanii TaxID=2911516 RepID=UPI001EF0F245|nr:nitrate reductase molybdenum cofactor assembly chaperone [Gordonia zhenghanii]MCF8568720.1 nitrate reductase molybdenum cofactor assembly chaperone [Gordonia zhenghanii]MCF8607296.1 nitrate reductase molybdenum cofactor assembly chaperone [Gordonia zhenghanii]